MGVAGTRQVMSTGDRPLGDLLRRAANAADPDDALRAITVLRGELDRLERDHVTCARVAGSSWSQIASALSITRQAAQKRHRGATPSASGPAPMRTVLERAARISLFYPTPYGVRVYIQHGAYVFGAQTFVKAGYGDTTQIEGV